MFDEIDEALRRLLIEEIPIRNNEIEIAFDQPRREWSARLNRPTLNIFLHDVRENAQLRQSYTQRQQPHPDRRQTALQRPEARVDLHYMITAWASEPDDEHRLLARTLLAFLRHREMPESFLPASLRKQPRPVAVSVAVLTSDGARISSCASALRSSGVSTAEIQTPFHGRANNSP